MISAMAAESGFDAIHAAGCFWRVSLLVRNSQYISAVDYAQLAEARGLGAAQTKRTEDQNKSTRNKSQIYTHQHEIDPKTTGWW